MSALRVVPSLLVASVAACSSTTAPPPPVSLLVQNTACAAAGCDTVYVVGVPNKQPNTPGGPWLFDLGVVTGQSACLSIPASKVFRIIEQPSGHETRIVWTTADTLTLGFARRPWTRTDAVPETPGFSPAAATGWSVVYPTDSVPTPAASCRAG
jgi:hypothetical protein